MKRINLDVGAATSLPTMPVDEQQQPEASASTIKLPPPVHSTGLRRWPLIVEARIWRGLMRIGMWMHKRAKPRPVAPAFTLKIPATLSPRKGNIKLVFYLPDGYTRGSEQRWPVIVNFHGGGFTLGAATDDARWAMAVCHNVGAVLVSVAYRRAPEKPFPTAVEDGADAILWLLDHAAELSLDSERLGVSGFSAGGNMALTATLRLQDALLRRAGASDADLTGARRHAVKLVASWYPSTDYTRARAERRASSVRPDKALPGFFTRLFDKSYLHPPRDVALDSPYLSPGVADDALLALLPYELLVWTCEWDMLHDEGERFRARMAALGKRVGGRTISGVPHAWDRAPNPLREDATMREVYAEACEEIRRIFQLGPVDDSQALQASQASIHASSMSKGN